MTEHELAASGMRPLDGRAPLRWLASGWRDLWANPLPGLMHGVALAAFGALLLWLAHDQFWWLAGAFSGFLIVAPVLACGLYAVSRQAQQGRRMGCREVMGVWLSGDRRLIAFGLLLVLAGTGWVLTSAGLITLWASAPVEKPADFLRHVVLAPAPGLFEVWLLLGALLAAPMFASSVVTLPLLMDTRLPLWMAIGESWRAVGSHPVVMAWWAALIAALVILGLATGLIGLVVVVPLLGHASWHAYVDLRRLGVIRVSQP